MWWRKWPSLPARRRRQFICWRMNRVSMPLRPVSRHATPSSGSPIRGPGASTNSVSHPDRPSGVMRLPDWARCLVHRAPGFSLSGGCAAEPRASHPSGSRRRAGRRWRMCPGPWHMSRAPENRRCHVASNWLDHRSRGSRWRRVQPLVAHDMGAGPRNTLPSRADGGCDGVQSDLMVLSQPLSWLAVATWPSSRSSASGRTAFRPASRKSRPGPTCLPPP